MAQTRVMSERIQLTPESKWEWGRDPSIDVEVIDDNGTRRAHVSVDRRGMIDVWGASPTAADLDRIIALLQQARDLLT